MPKHKSKAYVSDSDDSDISDDEKAAKKRKMEKKKKQKAEREEDEGSDMIQLSNKRYVSVREFKGKCLIDIREYYDAGGELKPGKKGISLTTDQWRRLKEAVDDIDEKIADLDG
ncbi:activated RNA polymerase II transcriptional coactivator p15-like isoform X2 [Branchiostoma floridae]|uniref:Activated RNA polymerase II transcriptional coactivator p15 n=1 Tax=Branchiostoma floridae TaxID=7739 RepID=A0A9J7MGU9_BRAFL|nr:activated RNA polymerase II transcriptional coactivator p15-like isoform X2 [Branchiostoma floridae]